MARPRISFVIPAYNAEKTLRETIESLQRQTIGEWEAVLIDDGSKDGTLELANALAATESRLRVFSQPNGGASSARNNGVSKAEAKFIAFLDADDWLDDHFIEKLLPIAEAGDGKVIPYCMYRRVRTDGMGFDVPITDLRGDKARVQFSQVCATAIHTLVFPKAAFDEAGGMDTTLRTCEDWKLWLSFAFMGLQYEPIEECLAYYRMTPGSLTHNGYQMLQDGVFVTEYARGLRLKAIAEDPRLGELYFYDPSVTQVGLLAWIVGIFAVTGIDAEKLFTYLPQVPDTHGLEDYVASALSAGLGSNYYGRETISVMSTIPEWVDAIDTLFAGLARYSLPGLERTLWEELLWKLSWQPVPKEPLKFRNFLMFSTDMENLGSIAKPEGVDTGIIAVSHKGKIKAVVRVPLWGDVSPRTIARGLVRQLNLPLHLKTQSPVRLAPPSALEFLRQVPVMVDILRNPVSRKGRLKNVIAKVARAGLEGSARSSDSDSDANARAVVGQIRSSVWGQAVGTPHIAPARATNDNGIDKPPAADFKNEVVHTVPVLMYHRISEDGPEGLSRYRTTPSTFREQMRFLRDNGFYSINSYDLLKHRKEVRPFKGRPVLISFDDAYQDFADEAFPILAETGMSAEVFVVSDKVGGTSDWDSAYGPPAPLMDWDEIRRLRAGGITFGSHMASHTPATALSSESLLDEAARSRLTLERELGIEVTSIAMPYGYMDNRVPYALEMAGYKCAYTTESGYAWIRGRAYELPRQEVWNGMSMDEFAEAVRVGSTG